MNATCKTRVLRDLKIFVRSPPAKFKTAPHLQEFQKYYPLTQTSRTPRTRKHLTCTHQGWELAFLRPNCENLAVFTSCLAAKFCLIFWHFLSKNLAEFWPNLHVVPHSEIYTL